LAEGTLYRFKVSAINTIGQGEWSDVVAFYACEKPADPVDFEMRSQSETQITVGWKEPASAEHGGCPVTGYRVWLENILEPGMKIVYNGVQQSTQTSLSLSYPTIRPGQKYKFFIQSKNCGLFSEGAYQTIASGKEPDQPPVAPDVLTYDSTTEMTIHWEAPSYDGGFSVEKYTLYVAGTPTDLEADLNPSLNYLRLTGLVLGRSYKLQVSATNEIGESQLSVARTLLFANVPTKPASLTLTASIDPTVLLAEWASPSSENGDAVSGYQVYVDDGFGGPFTLVYNGQNFPSTYQFSIQGLVCGR
jgi:hypothetical protein